MGYTKLREEESARSSLSSSFNEALLFSTMCIIGLQVHVHVKDGSVYSGMFYTASVKNDFGIVLKNAKLIKKGTSKANVTSGSIVKTLVILSSNIVQIIAETEYHHSFLNHQRQGSQIVEHDEPTTDFQREDNLDVQSSSSSLDSASERIKPIEEDKMRSEPPTHGRCHDADERPPSTHNSLSHSTTTTEGSGPSSNGPAPTQATYPIKKPKEFKLNPGAKMFSPSLAKRVSPIPAGVPAVGNMTYIPSNTPMFPVLEAVLPEAGLSPFVHNATLLSKLVPYNNLIAGNASSGSLSPQSMHGPLGSRAQPFGLTYPYHHPLQAPQMLTNPNPQMMVNRLGQVVYMQPVSQDLIHGAPAPALAPLPSHPLLTTQQLYYPKHRGVVVAGQIVPICVPQPFMGSGDQSYIGLPPVLQHPMTTVPSTNGCYLTKFP